MRKFALLGAAIAALLALPAQATLTTTASSQTYIGSGSTGPFSVPFKFLAATDLVVTKSLIGSNVTSTLALTTDYTVTGAGTTSGAVTLTTAISSSYTLTISRVVPLTQPTNLRTARTFSPATHEAAFDRLTMQIQQLQNGTLPAPTIPVLAGAVSLSQVNGRCMVDQYAGANLGAKLATALADATCTARIYDATGLGNSSTSTLTLTSDVTINVVGATVLLPFGIITMGTYRFVVPVSTHNVSILGVSAWGGDGAMSVSTARGTYLYYTGTDAAVKVGDSTDDTSGFHLSDLAIYTSGGASAVGLQLNRVTNYRVERARIQHSYSVTGQKGIDLEGGSNYTGGTIADSWLSVGPTSTGIYFGTNANANTVIGVLMAGQTSSSIGYEFSSAGGNSVYGGDTENMRIAYKFTNSQGNVFSGVRQENNTYVYSGDSGSSYNNIRVSSNEIQAGQVVDASGGSSVYGPIHFAINPARGLFGTYTNNSVSSTLMIMDASAAQQDMYFTMHDTFGDKEFTILRQKTGNLWMSYVAGGSGYPFLIARPATTSTIFDGGLSLNSYNGYIDFNSATGASTSGTRWMNGAGGTVATLDGTGNLKLAGPKSVGTITLSSGSGTSTVAASSICTCTDTSNAFPVKCVVSSTTLTASTPSSTSDVVAYHCF